MTRAVEFLLRNWPLKLAAVGLATVLYAGVVLSENTRDWPGQVPIEVVSPPTGGALLDLPGTVSDIRYRAPLDVAAALTSGSFRAVVNLQDLRPQTGGPAVEVPVQLFPLDPRVEIVGFTPRSLNIRLDTITGRTMPVTVESGTPPEGLVLSPSQSEPAVVTLRGASARISRVRSATAQVAIDASGLNVDQEVDVDALDENGELVPGVEVSPARVRVRIDVARQLAYATLPVVVTTSGEVEAGRRITSITSDPLTVTVSGEAPAVAGLVSLETLPVEVTGLRGDTQVETALDPPADITVIGSPTVMVDLRIVPVRATRALEAGVVLEGSRRDRVYALSTPSLLVTLSGPSAALDLLAEAPLRATVSVEGLGNGRHELTPVIDAGPDLEVVSITPESLVVRISSPVASTDPSPAPPPSPAGPSPADPTGSAPAPALADP